MLEEIFTKLIGNAIVAAGRAIKVHNLEMFSKNNFEVTPEQYVILSVLNEDNLFHQNKLCEQIYKDKSNMTRILTILENRGYIEKIQETENKKLVNKIKITSSGKKLRDKITPFMNESRKQYLKNISHDEMYVCIKVLSQIQENLAQKE